jgi:hypothetical protein
MVLREQRVEVEVSDVAIEVVIKGLKVRNQVVRL